MSDLAEFRDETREWLEENCPESLRGPGQVLAGGRKETQELKLRIMGHRALAWAEDGGFSSEELEATRTWLFSKAGSIAGGSNEVQMNVIAKRVLGLPD